MLFLGDFVGTWQAPVIDAIIEFPKIARTSANTENILFQIDTGADSKIIFPQHLKTYRHSDFRGYPTDESRGLGGKLVVWRIPVHFRFYTTSDDGTTQRLDEEITVDIPEPDEKLKGLPNLLGRDVLRFFRLTIDQRTGLVSLDDGE